MKKQLTWVLAGSMMMTALCAAPAFADELTYHDYNNSDKYVAAEEAAKYEGSDEWPEITWNFDCSTGETSTWAQAGYYFNALMQESTGGKVQVEGNGRSRRAAKLAQKDGCKTQVSIEKRKQMWYAIRAAL